MKKLAISLTAALLLIALLVWQPIWTSIVIYIGMLAAMVFAPCFAKRDPQDKLSPDSSTVPIARADVGASESGVSISKEPWRCQSCNRINSYLVDECDGCKSDRTIMFNRLSSI